MRFEAGNFVLPGSLECAACGPLMAPLAIASTVLSTGLSVMGAMAQGEAAEEAAAFEARQLENKANEARAIGQKKMFEERKKTDLAQSRLTALSAASGGGATDDGVLNLAEGMGKRGEYAALMEFTTGENRARGYQDQAAAAIYEGKVKKQAAGFKAAGSFMDGIGSFATQYNKFYPKSSYG